MIMALAQKLSKLYCVKIITSFSEDIAVYIFWSGFTALYSKSCSNLIFWAFCSKVEKTKLLGFFCLFCFRHYGYQMSLWPRVSFLFASNVVLFFYFDYFNFSLIFHSGSDCLSSFSYCFYLNLCSDLNRLNLIAAVCST